MKRQHNSIKLILKNARVLFLALCVLLFTHPISAQPPTSQTTTYEATSKPDDGDQLYLDFKAAGLINILSILSELTGINFVAGNELTDRNVNMVLEDAELDDALDAIGQGSNVMYDKLPGRNIYLFRASADDANKAPLVTRVFKLHYIQASELKEITAGETTTSSGGGGGVGGTGSSTFAELEEKDESGEGEEESTILKIIKDILSERGRVNVDDRSNSVTVTDTRDRLQMIEQAIVELDRPLDQVLIRVILLETFEDLDRFLGIEWGTTTSEGEIGQLTGGSQTSRFPFNVGHNKVFRSIFQDNAPFNRGTITETTTAGSKSFTDLTVILKALQAAGTTKIIAKPRILVLDNHPALIKITTNEAIGAATIQTAAGQLSQETTNVAERTQTGTSLRVTPLINSDERITMTLEPRFVTAASAASGASQTRDPTIRTARTTLMLNDGQTIVLGGLLSSQQLNDVRKTPFLGDIPFIGEIFTRRKKTIDDRELMLFLSPTIIKDPSQVQALYVPDERDRMDDVTVPFWKYKRKKWYQDLKAEVPSPEVTDTSPASLVQRGRLMDDTLLKIARQQSDDIVTRESKEKIDEITVPIKKKPF